MKSGHGFKFFVRTLRAFITTEPPFIESWIRPWGGGSTWSYLLWIELMRNVHLKFKVTTIHVYYIIITVFLTEPLNADGQADSRYSDVLILTPKPANLRQGFTVLVNVSILLWLI